MKITHQEVISFSIKVITSLIKDKNIASILPFISDNLTWIGPEENIYMTSKEEVIHYFLKRKNDPLSYIIEFDECTIPISSEGQFLVVGGFHLRSDQHSSIHIETHQRFSLSLVQRNNQLIVSHLHLSYSSSHKNKEDVSSSEAGNATYSDLQKKLAEQIEVIEMVSNTIDGGLKGSNDDDLYSYYYVNEGLPKMLGYTHDEFMVQSGGTAVGAVYPPDLQQALQDCADCFEIGPSYTTQYRMRKKDGSLLWVLDRGRKTLTSDGETKINSIITDITPLKSVLSELEIEREKYRIVLENISEIMFEYDVVHDCLYIYKTNQQNKLKKMKIARFIGRLEQLDYIHLDDIGHIPAFLHYRTSHSIEIRTRMNSKSKWNWLRVQSSPIKNRDGQVIQWVGSLKDVTEEKKIYQTLKDLAHKDPLTGILNSNISEKKINKYLQKHSNGFLLIIDIDQFKTVNDTMGHLVGNQVLMQVANVLQHSFRETDIVARIGGDEFLVFLKGENDSFIEHKINDLLNQLRQIEYKPDQTITCSIGIAEACFKYNTYESLFSVADKALYHSKQNGKNQFCLYD